MDLIYKKGTKVKITKLQEKDYTWLDGQFEELTKLCTGQEAIILSHNEEIAEFGERESYQVLVKDADGKEQELEIELDEFIVEQEEYFVEPMGDEII